MYYEYGGLDLLCFTWMDFILVLKHIWNIDASRLLGLGLWIANCNFKFLPREGWLLGRIQLGFAKHSFVSVQLLATPFLFFFCVLTSETSVAGAMVTVGVYDA